MSEIITAYPTSGLTDRSLNSVNTAIFDYISAIPVIADFFDSAEKLGDGSATAFGDYGIKLAKGSAYIKIGYSNANGAMVISNNSTSSTTNVSGVTNTTSANDIPIRILTGINGTTALWIDDFSKGVCLIFNEFEEKCFLANSSNSTSNSWYYSDTGGTVKNLAGPFNGNNIASGGDFIAQPYYHLGINTGDIYTFDGGSSEIPWGKFKLGNAEFVRLFKNFALRIK